MKKVWIVQVEGMSLEDTPLLSLSIFKMGSKDRIVRDSLNLQSSSIETILMNNYEYPSRK
jgi:hypothetical protein